MKYPIEIIYDPFLGQVEREMSATTYNERIQWFKDYIKNHMNDKPRRIQEYVSYLQQWFSSNPCDGWPDFKTRYALHQLPMSYNVYFN